MIAQRDLHSQISLEDRRQVKEEIGDMVRDTSFNEMEAGYSGRHVHWGAVIAGVLIAMVTQVLLGLLGLAIGLSTLDPTQQQDMSGLGIGSGIWLILSTIISVFVGSWAASWWANTRYRADGILHGVLTWSLFLMLTLMFIGSGLGSLIGGAFNLLSAGVTGASQGVAMSTMRPAGTPAGTTATERPAAGQLNMPAIQNRLNQLLSASGPAGDRLAKLDTSNQVKQQINQRIMAGDNAGAARLISQNTGLTMAESQSLVMDSQMEQREVAEQATDTASKVAWWAFLATLLSLIAGAIGGMMGNRRRYVNT
jgi:hypothetical protein